MKITSWNCNMAFRKKIDALLELSPDIAIVQECEHINKIIHFNIYDKVWVGKNLNKGVGIFSFNENIKIELIDFDYHNNHWFIPFKANGLLIVAVWAMNHRDNETLENVLPTYRTLKQNEILLKADIIMGDFNDNVVWDKKIAKKITGSFSQNIELLKSHNFESVYHHQIKEAFGEELTPTLIWRKSLKTTYHVDYCFIKQALLNQSVYQIYDDPKWLQISDHYPISITI